MLKNYGAIYCWGPLGAKAEKSSCKNEDANPGLAECVEELRGSVTIFTGEEIARENLRLCMQRKGWDLLFVDGWVLG